MSFPNPSKQKIVATMTDTVFSVPFKLHKDSDLKQEADNLSLFMWKNVLFAPVEAVSHWYIFFCARQWIKRINLIFLREKAADTPYVLLSCCLFISVRSVMWTQLQPPNYTFNVFIFISWFSVVLKFLPCGLFFLWLNNKKILFILISSIFQSDRWYLMLFLFLSSLSTSVRC